MALLLTLICALPLSAQPGPKNITNQYEFDSWSFKDTTNWTDDFGDPPMSFTNLSSAPYGNGNALVVDSTNQAWLQFAVFQDGETNLAVNQGTVMFWFSSDWNSVNRGGTGPGEPYGALIETGSYTADASVGWWSIYIDAAGSNIYFSAQTNGSGTTYLSAPIAWTNNDFHLLAIAYDATNTQLFIDGTNAAIGPPMTNYPMTPF